MNNDFKIPFHKPIVLDEHEMNRIIPRIENCIFTGKLTNGDEVRKLESAISSYYSVKHAIATSSATQALVITLQSLKREYNVGKFVHTQSFAWYSSLYSIVSAGLIPLWHDIKQDTWTMDYNISYNRQPKKEIVLPVHTFGNVSKIDEASYIIYDGAHCLGSEIKDFGNATVISLAPTKLITSIEGGIILTDDSKLAETIIKIRDKVSRMSEIHAIFGNSYLEHLKEIMEFKKEVFRYYSTHLDGVFQKKALSHNYNTIGMLTHLKIPPHIETKKYYEPLFTDTLSSKLSNTEFIYKKIICLPSYFSCSYKEITDTINKYNSK